MNWHGFSMYGMGGPMTDPGEYGFSQRVNHELGVNIHGSPYRDYEAGEIAAMIDKLPPEDGVFVWGTSLGANDTPVVCSYVKRDIQGAFGFQASIYGAKGYRLNSTVKFAHLIYSHNPIPFPGLGAYLWPLGTMDPANYHKTKHNIPHPGDYDHNDQTIFIEEMRHIMAATKE